MCVSGNSYLKNMDDHHCSGRFGIPKRALFRASVYLVAVLGCALQSNYISQDYWWRAELTTLYLHVLSVAMPITRERLNRIGPSLACILGPPRDRTSLC